jgi:hypothetical protein
MAEKVVEDLSFLEKEQVLEGFSLLFLQQSCHDLVEVSAEDRFKAYIVVFTFLRHLQELHQLVHKTVIVLGFELFGRLFFVIFYLVFFEGTTALSILLDRN